VGPWDWTRPPLRAALDCRRPSRILRNRAVPSRRLSRLFRISRDLGYTISTIENSPANKLMSGRRILNGGSIHRGGDLAGSGRTFRIPRSATPERELIPAQSRFDHPRKTNGGGSLDDVMRAPTTSSTSRAQTQLLPQGTWLHDEDFGSRGFRYRRSGHDRLLQRLIRGTETLPYDDAFSSFGLVS